MSDNYEIDDAINLLSAAIEETSDKFLLYMERGKLYHRKGLFGNARNDFRQALEIKPDDREAEAYISLITEILNYRYKDIYNP